MATIQELRAEAKSRGITGVSRLSKPELERRLSESTGSTGGEGTSPEGQSQTQSAPEGPNVDSKAVGQAQDASERAAEQVRQQKEQGFVGVKVDPNPNEAYSTQTGPDSPTLVSDDRTRVPQFAAPRAEVGETEVSRV